VYGGGGGDHWVGKLRAGGVAELISTVVSCYELPRQQQQTFLDGTHKWTLQQYLEYDRLSGGMGIDQHIQSYKMTIQNE